MSEIVIAHTVARQIIDAQGMPTLELNLYLNNQAMVTTSLASSGQVSTSFNPDEATDYTDNLNVNQAVDFINQVLAPAINNQNPVNQEQLDDLVLKTTQKQNIKLNANVTMAVSQAILKAAAISYGWPTYYYVWRRYQLIPQMRIPTCLFTMFNGGSRGDNNMDFHETQIIPANSVPFNKALEYATMTFRALRNVLIAKGGGQATSSIGGFIPVLPRNTDAFDLLVEAIRSSGLVMGRDLFFGVDLEADHFFSLGKYKLKDSTSPLTSQAFLDYLKRLHTNYGVYLFEDPFDSSDIASWKKFQAEMGSSIRLVSDKLSKTNVKEVEKAISQKVANTFCIKPAQVANISEVIDLVRTIRPSGNKILMAHKEGETTDDFIADLAVGIGADYCKFGPPNRGERVVKYNRLLKIETELNQINASQQATTQTQATTPATTTSAPQPAPTN